MANTKRYYRTAVQGAPRKHDVQLSPASRLLLLVRYGGGNEATHEADRRFGVWCAVLDV